ncbi:MAG: hypothetical protein U0793_28510 [Gemmataceae bacterium]
MAKRANVDDHEPTKAEMARTVIRGMIEEGVAFSFPEVRRRIKDKFKADVVNATINNVRREMLGGGPVKLPSLPDSPVALIEAMELIRRIGDAIGWDQVDRIVAAVRR